MLQNAEFTPMVANLVAVRRAVYKGGLEWQVFHIENTSDLHTTR